MRRAVGAGHRDRVGVVGAGCKRVVRVVGRVGPGTRGVNGELAVAAGAGDSGLRHEGGRAVNVADGQRAAGADGGGSVAFRQAGRVGAADGSGVVGAKDVDRYRAGGAVSGGHRERVGVGGAVDELVVGGTGGVSPDAVCAENEGAVGAGRADLGNVGLCAVNVGDGQGATGGERGVRLGQALGCAGENRSVVGAGDGDRDCAGGAVSRTHIETVRVGGARFKLVVGGAGGVGPDAGCADDEGAVAASSAGLGNVCLCAVNVGDCQGATGGEHGVCLGQVLSSARENCCVVRAVDVEHRRYVRRSNAVRHLNCEAVRYVAGCRQSLGVTVAVVQRVAD